MKDLNGITIDNSWRGTNCKKLMNNPDYREYRRVADGLEFKNREHYYVKSYSVAKTLADSGIDDLFHIGCGKERYPFTHKWCGIRRTVINELHPLNKYADQTFVGNFYTMPALPKPVYDNSLVLSEATFYTVINRKNFGLANTGTEGFVGLSEEEYLKLEHNLMTQMNILVKNGYKSVMMIENEVPFMENLHLPMKKHKFRFNDDFKYDFSTNYATQEETLIYLWTDNELLVENVKKMFHD